MSEEEPQYASVQENERNRAVFRAGYVGIATNIALAGVKAFIGLAANSISVVLDAVNNMSDAVSSVVTIIGTKFASAEADMDHPLGHGRIEYLAALTVAGLILWAGITSLVESAKKIADPVTPEYSLSALIVIAVTILVKIVLSRYVKRTGIRVKSTSLVAAGTDAGYDAIISASVLASAIFFTATGISLEAWLGLLIALFIIRSGIELITETLNDILGKRTDAALSKDIKSAIKEEPQVLGAYDLYIFNYGPGLDYATVHIEIPDTMTAHEIDQLERKITVSIKKKFGIILTGIGIYAVSSSDPEIMAMRESVGKAVLAHKYALGVHGFFADIRGKEIAFDAVIDFSVNKSEAVRELTGEIEKLYPGYTVRINPDCHITD